MKGEQIKMIKIVMTAEEKETEVELKSSDMSVLDIQAIIGNLELVKLNLLGELAKLVDIQKLK